MVRKLLKLAFILFLTLVLALLAFLGTIRYGVFGAIPTEEELAEIHNHEASLLLSSDEVIIGKIYDQNRSNITFEDIPSHAINALIATEDARFMSHEGVDIISLFRVLIKTIILGDSHAGGGSTISQQLIKNIYGRPVQPFFSTPINKIKEMFAANRLESVYNKQEILTLYLNTVSFGENIYGIENASQRYFSKHTKELKIEESAVLIGMLKANTYYNPRQHPEHALKRRNVVLKQTVNYASLQEDVYDSLKTLPLGAQYKGASDIEAVAPYFVHQAKKEARKIIEAYNIDNNTDLSLNTDGLIIKTTLNSKTQSSAQQAYYTHLRKLQQLLDKQLEKEKFWQKNAALPPPLKTENVSRSFIYPDYGLNDTVKTSTEIDSIRYALSRLQGSMFSVEVKTGKIIAYIGGTNFHYYPYDRTLSKRQVGSVFKPLVYYTALEQGVTPCTFYANELRSYPEYDNWTPKNSDGKYEGFYSLTGALTNSVNTITSQVAIEAGLDRCIGTANTLGITSEIQEVPSLALGTSSISLQEMVSAYIPLAATGNKIEPYMIASISLADGTVIYEHELSLPSPVLDPKYADMMKAMLVSVVDSGTARRLRFRYELPFDIAGKTGTTQNNTDGWFIGFSNEVVTGVWVGVDNPAIHFTSTAIGQGANTALPIWANYYASLHEEKQYEFSPFEYHDINLKDQMDCALYREKKPNLFESIFSKKKYKKTRHRKDEKKKKWSLFKRNKD